MLDIPPPPPDAETQGEIKTDEIKKNHRQYENRKTPGIDVITPDVLKAGGDPMVAMMRKIFNAVYDTEKQTPKDCAQTMVTPIHKKGDK